MANPFDISYQEPQALTALFRGFDQAYKEQEQASKLQEIQQMAEHRRLQNERYGQMTPLELQKTGLEAAQAEVLNNPDALNAYAAGKIGTAQQQQVLGAEAVRKAKLFENFNKLRETALNPEIPQDMRNVAVSDAKNMAALIAATDPENIAKLQQIGVKSDLSGQKLSPGDRSLAVSLAEKNGWPFEKAMDTVIALKEHMSQGQQSKPSTNIFGFQQNQPTPVQNDMKIPQGDQLNRDKDRLHILEQEMQLYPNDVNLQKEYKDVKARIGGTNIQQPQQQPIVVKPVNELLKEIPVSKSKNATVENTAYAVAENSGQIVKALDTLTKAPAGSALSTFAGIDGKDAQTFLGAITASAARAITPTDERMTQQLLSGIEMYLANALGNGNATAASLGRIKLLGQQLPRAGKDSEVQMALFLGRLHDEMGILFENYQHRPGVNKGLLENMKRYEETLNGIIKFSANDVVSALNKTNTSVGQDALKRYANTSKLTGDDFNSLWAKLEPGEKLVGPDGIEYTKKGK